MRRSLRGSAQAFELMETLDEKEVLGVSVRVLCELRGGAELCRRVNLLTAALEDDANPLRSQPPAFGV